MSCFASVEGDRKRKTATIPIKDIDGNACRRFTIRGRFKGAIADKRNAAVTLIGNNDIPTKSNVVSWLVLPWCHSHTNGNATIVSKSRSEPDCLNIQGIQVPAVVRDHTSPYKR